MPEDSIVALVPLPLEDVIRLLFRYTAQAVSTDIVQDKEQWVEEFTKKDVGVDVLRSLRNLTAFQPKKPPPEQKAKHMTVIPQSSPAKGTEQVSRKA